MVRAFRSWGSAVVAILTTFPFALSLIDRLFVVCFFLVLVGLVGVSHVGVIR